MAGTACSMLAQPEYLWTDDQRTAVSAVPDISSTVIFDAPLVRRGLVALQVPQGGPHDIAAAT